MTSFAVNRPLPEFDLWNELEVSDGEGVVIEGEVIATTDGSVELSRSEIFAE